MLHLVLGLGLAVSHAQLVARPVPTSTTRVAAPLAFSHTPQTLNALGVQHGALLTDALNSVAALPVPERAFATTVKAMSRAYGDYYEAIRPAVFLASVSPDPAVRQAAEALDKSADAMMVALGQREDLYQAVKDAAAKGEALDGPDQRLLESTLKEFTRSGLGMDAAARSRMAAVDTRLNELSSAFSRNLRDADLTLTVAEKHLKGLPAAMLAGLPRTQGGRVRLRLDAPTYGLVMERAESRGLRRAAYLKHGNAAAAVNGPILQETLALRHESARMLGFKNYAEMALSGRMAQEPKRVWAFLNKLRLALKGPRAAEKKELRDYAKAQGAKTLKPWDSGFWEARMKRERLAFDPEAAREFFPMDAVLAKTFRIYEELLGVRLTEVQAEGAWHPEVRLVEVTDAATGAKLGRFYLDLFPREAKYGHMAAFTLVSGRELADGTYRMPVSALVGNFTRPSGGRPSLLRPSEVKTLFHELGHIMHQTLTKSRHWSQSGSATARDFVEAPSQMMESFVWRKDTLVDLSGHWSEPSRKLSADTAERIVADKFFSPASDALGQAVLSAFDLAVHSSGAADALKVYAKVVKAFLGGAPAAGTNFPARFGHIMGGYAAGYYGYLWSRVFALDAFSAFEAAGVFSSEVGRRWREAVLERGSERPESESLKDFLGRDPDEGPFLRSLNRVPLRPST